MDDNNVLPRNDHDTLIRLETKFDSFSTQISKDVRELNDGVITKLAQLEARVLIMEKVHTETQPLIAMKRLQDIDIWKGNLQSNLKFMIAIAGAIGGLVGVISSIMLILSHVIKL